MGRRDVNFDVNVPVNISGEQQIARLETQLQASREEAEKLRNWLWEAQGSVQALEAELDRLKTNSGIAILEEELSRFKDTARQSIVEVRSYLESVNLSDVWGNDAANFDHIFQKIEEGSMTAQQAILKIKTEYAELLTEFSRDSGAFDVQTLKQFATAMENLSTKMDDVLDRLFRIENEGVKAIGDGIGSITGGSGGSGLNDLSEVMDRIRQTAEQMSETATASLTSISNLVDALKGYAEIDGTKLIGVSQAFRNMADLGTGSFSAKSVDNLVYLAKQVAALNEHGNFNFHFDVEGLRDFKVSSTIHHLSDFLNSINESQVASLERLSKVNLSNFHQDNLKISKTTADSVKELMEQNEAMSQAAKAAEEDKAGMEAAAKAEEDKARIADLLEKALEREEKRTRSAGKAAKEHADQARDAANAKREAAEQAEHAADAEESAETRALAITRQVMEAQEQYNDIILDSANKKLLGVGASLDYGNTIEGEFRDIVKALPAHEEYNDVILDGVGRRQLGVGASLNYGNVIEGEFRDITDALPAHKEYNDAVREGAEAAEQASGSARDNTEATAENNGVKRQAATINKEFEDALFGESAAGKEAADSARQYNIELTNVNNTLRNVNNALHTMANTEGGQSRPEYNELLKLRDALQSLKDAGTTTPLDELREKLSALKLTQSEALVEMNLFTNAVKDEAAATKQQEALNGKRVSMLTQLNGMLKQCTDAQQKYALAARLGVAGDAYKNIQLNINSIHELIDALRSGGNVTEEMAREFDRLKLAVSDTSTALHTTGNLVNRWATTGMQQLKSRLSYSIGLAAIAYKAANEIKKMANTAIELDTAMNQLQIVTRSSSADMDVYAKRVSAMAKETAQATKDLIDATTVYARLGYSMDESATLAKYTAMLQGVGDIGASDAQNALTAILKAFNKDVDDVEDVMNKMVVVGNNFPISVSQIAEGMNNAGSMLSVAGNSLEQSIALLTASNATVQNISKASTGLRTIAARIRKTTTDEDDGEPINEAKYEEVVNLLTKHKVLLTDANNEYRSTYDILKDIAGIWNELNSMEQAAVIEQLAGTRQQNIFSSIITQFQDAEGAMQRMTDSSGELQEAYDIYLDSIEAHVKTMKAAYDELAMDFVDSSLTKGVIDILTKIIELLDRIISNTETLTTVLSAGALFGIIKLLTGNAIPSAILSISKFFIHDLPLLVAMAPELAMFATALAGIVTIAGEVKKVKSEGFLGEGHKPEDYAKNVESLTQEVDRLQKEYDNLAACGADLTMVENELAHAQNALRNATDEYTASLEEQERQAENTKYALELLQRGGNVNLLKRPVITAQKLTNAGWGDVGGGGATVYTNTYSNENGSVAMNFTPILVDNNGDYVGVLSPEELEEYANGVIEGVHDDYLNLKIGATYYGKNAIEYAEQDAEKIHELHEEYYKDDLKMIDDFQESLHDLSDKTLKKLLSAEELTQDETEELALWLQKSGRSAEDSGKLFEDYADDLRNAAKQQEKLRADQALGDLTSLQDELNETTDALEKYKEAMKGGEKGDAVNEMADIYKGALEDLKSGRVDSRRVHNAAELFFSQEQLAEMDYDMAEIGRRMQDSMLQALFDPEGESKLSYGQRFAQYIEQNASKFAQAGAAVEKTASGYKFHYDSLQKLADAFGVSREACSAFLDDLDAYGVEVMRSKEENIELANQFFEIQNAAGNARDAVVEFIKRLSDAGRDSMEIKSILDDLSKKGVIRLNSDEINDILIDTMNGLQDIDKENVEPSVTLNTTSAYASANNLHNYLTSLFSKTITQTISVNYAGQTTSRTGAYQNYTGKSGQGASRAEGGVTGKAGPTLVNELGPELISDKGKAFIANHGQPGFVNLSENAIVFNAKETKDILRDSDVLPKRAYADGTRKDLIGRLLGSRDIPAEANTWVCKICGSRNDSSATKCWKCKNTKGASNTAAAIATQKGTQTAQTTTTKTTTTQPTTTTKTTTTQTPTSAGSTKWTCNWCGRQNPQTAVKCQNPSCGQTRGTIPQQNTPSTPAQEKTVVISGHSYWTCSNCGRTNTATTNYCAGCGKYRFSNNTTTLPQTKIFDSDAEQSLNYEELFDFGDGGGGGGGGATGQSTSNPQKIDWIAVKLSRIQREISDLETVASSGLKKLDTRLSAAKKEASKLNEEIDIAQKGYTRYMQEANSVGLSSDLAEKVRNGTIDINEYDDDELRQQIQEYQEWYFSCRPSW
jgi:TP901 family phage tail tape measure protein